MRDTEKLPKQQPPDRKEPVATAKPMSTAEPALAVEPMPATGPAPVPADEAGLERGGPAQHAPVPDAPTLGGPDHRKPEHAKPAHGKPGTGKQVSDEPMFSDDAAERLRIRWRELQADFVDDPQRAVRAADDVVDEMMRTIAERRKRLTGEWQGHTDTEELRLALRGYRSFVDTLLPH